jgi:hypothetical protein
MTTEQHTDDPPKYDLQIYDKNGVLLYSHPEDSLYAGLTLDQQLFLSKKRRGKGRVPKSILKMWHKADKHLYADILKHCVDTLIHASEDYTIRLDRVYVRMRLPFNYRTKCNKDFPRPVIVGYDDWHIYCQFRVDPIVDYLYSIGHSTFDAKQLRRELWSIRNDFDKYLWYDQYTIPLCTTEYLNEAIPQATIARTEKGKGKWKRTYVYKRKEKECSILAESQKSESK